MNRRVKRHQIQNFFKMKNIIVNGLFIVLLCSISTRLIAASPNSDDVDTYDDYTLEDDYYVFDDDEQTVKIEDDEITTENSYVEATVAAQTNANGPNDTNIEISSIAVANEEEKTESTFGVLIAESDIPQESDCPALCSCDEQLQFIDCSNKSLSEIPKRLPNSTLQINLANNYIKEIQENDLSNLTVARTIILKNNAIGNVNQSMFRWLHRLDDLDLSSNKISEIDPDVFVHAQSLSTLTLNDNPLTFKANQSFLNLPDLQTLNLVGCNVTEFYDQTFTNLSGLTLLNLADNPLVPDKAVNAAAFSPLVVLIKLKFPQVSPDETYELCTQIQPIDVINFDRYNISCYELVSGSTYDESKITEPPPTVKTSTTPMSTTTTADVVVQEVKESTTKAAKQNATQTNSTRLRANDYDSYDYEMVTKTNALNTTNGGDVKSQEVEMSTQSIKTVLIASIIVAVVGLAIGLVCRKDVFGVKTKLCRTQRPEQPTIPEQVPLNKVEQLPPNKV